MPTPSAPPLPPHNAHPLYRPDIDGLRAVAIFVVVLFHAYPKLLPGGFVGVDVFFVISGFLISTILFRSLQRGDFDFAEFYVHRVKRIFPALAVVLAVVYGLGWVLLLPDEFAQLGKHMAAGAGFVQNFVLWQEAGYFATASELKPLMHLWSLAIEEQFYLLYPVLIWGVWRLGLNSLTVLFVLAAVSFGLNVSGIDHATIATFFAPQTRFWELLAGAGLAYLQLFKRAALAAGLRQWVLDPVLSPTVAQTAQQDRTLHSALSVLGAGLIVLAVFVLNKERAFPGWWAILPVAGACLLILAGGEAWVNRQVLACRPMVWLGLVSYPLYLWHWPLLSLAQIVESDTPPGKIRVAAMLLSVLLAWLTYRLLEKPIRFGRGSGRTVAVLCATVATLGGVGYATSVQQGIPTRSIAKANAQNKFDYPYRQSCAPLMGAPHADDWCHAGNATTAPPNTVMVGDSIANAYAETLLQFAASHPEQGVVFRQFGRGQCPMLLDYGPAYCRELTRAAIAEIAHTATIQTVILAAHWPAYFNGKHFAWLNHIETPESFDRAWRTTLAHYQQQGKRVVVWLSPPTGSQPRDCFPRLGRLTESKKCVLPLALAQQREGAYRLMMLPVLAERGVSVFDPFPSLCTAQSCQTTAGAWTLYSNGEHFSQYGGRFLAERADADLARVLAATAPPSNPTPRASPAKPHARTRLGG